MREIVFDTETTGFDPKSGDRIVEIGALELINHLPTGVKFHKYINPERDMPEGAFSVHGLSEEFLSDKPLFADIVQEFDDFIKDDVLIAHNASFDMRFIHAERDMVGKSRLGNDVIDTLEIAKRKHPAGPNSLDALCRRYGIDNAMRDLHGALLDSELLAGVYLELIGGRQTSLTLAVSDKKQIEAENIQVPKVSVRPNPLPTRLTSDEIQAHQEFIEKMGDDLIWNKFINNKQ